MDPVVSVLIPAYNAQAFLRATVESVLAQTWSSLEVIIIDDGSSDETGSVADSLVRRDSRVRYYRQDNAGVSAARNAGLRVATGQMVGAIDADDLWVPTKLRRQIDLIATRPGTIALTGIRRFATASNGDVGWLATTVPPEFSGGNRGMEQLLALNATQMVIFNTALFHRQDLVTLGGWAVNFSTAEDWELWLRAARRFEFCSIDEPLQFYRKHSQSVTSLQNEEVVLRTHLGLVQRELTSGGVSHKAAQNAIVNLHLDRIKHLRYDGRLSSACARWLRLGINEAAWKHRRFWSELLDIGRRFRDGA